MALMDPDIIRSRLGGFSLGGSEDLYGIPVFTGEFWTSEQRKASSLHEISYRACFKAQLPQFFIDLLTKEGQVVYDPFSGRGTTPIQAALMGRDVISNDVNPLSEILTRPRLEVPDIGDVRKGLEGIGIGSGKKADIDLSMFYHPDTESEIASLREYMLFKDRPLNDVDAWIRMVATNRLTGHSPGFFSVYTLPPNQAVSRERQMIINEKRGQSPPYRDVRALILKKSRTLLKKLDVASVQRLRGASERAVFLTCDAANTPDIEDGSIDLIVSSPPFLNVVQYDADNWLRCWFNGIDPDRVAITIPGSLDRWKRFMEECFSEFFRVVRPGGFIAFEVGEIGKGSIPLEKVIAPVGIDAGFEAVAIVINSQEFTKTSNIWGVGNMSRGTNTNRIVLLRKPEGA
ncbi:MAG: DNA methyltransferase [Candidatus Thermoplasmatota archaeon]|nr:DNA methyltransferase [Candidatus Thermoplasmatota archaeon]